MRPAYIKRAAAGAPVAEATVRDRVSGMLSAIEAGGVDAIRRYSRDLDDWDPESFVVGEADVEAAARLVDDDLKRHIRFAQRQVRSFAEAQRASLVDIEVEVGEGVVLGHRHIAVGSVGAYVPGAIRCLPRRS